MPEPLTWDDLIRFHREIIAPDMEKIFSRLDRVDERFDDLDALRRRLDWPEREFKPSA
ncbi:MAG: hypothetical protein ACXW2P_03940 [Thermoanaerobaculia bacterium]